MPRFKSMKKKILVAPIYWGLGHATRCVPIIQELLTHNFDVIIASDGPALEFLKREFPNLDSVELPPYNIRYSHTGLFFKWKMISQLPSFYKTMNAEYRIIQQLVDEKKIDGIISDNRFGVRSPKVPSVYVSHQLNVLTGSTTFFSSFLHRKIIKKFDECWVPDNQTQSLNYSGKMGHLKKETFPVRYMGTISRMKKKEMPITNDILVLLSGPEPQRTLLEQRLLDELQGSNKKIILVQGIMEKEQRWSQSGDIKIVNFMETEELENILNQTETVISRPGYSTIMDLVALQKRAFFIPTPGQYEQDYLADRLKRFGMVPTCTQKRFELRHLNKSAVYSGMTPFPEKPIAISSLFDLF